MKMRTLGNSDIQASAVAFGAWAVGGWMWGGTDEDQSVAAIQAALDAGVNFIDTAPIYGFGLSEEVVGKAIRGRRDDVVLATKCGMVCDPTRGEFKFRSNAVGADPAGLIPISVHQDPESIREEVENSLQRLGTDRIELYQTHWQDSTTAIEDTMAALMALKDEGKIRAIGASNASPDQLRQYLDAGVLDADQEPFSMLDLGLRDTNLPVCREKGLAVLAYSPLANGLLTGKMGPDREFEEGDLRRDNPRFSVENRQRVADMLEAFQSVMDAHDLTPAQLTIAWTIHQPGLTHALCGARTPEQAVENARGGAVDLSEDELTHMDAVIRNFHSERSSRNA